MVSEAAIQELCLDKYSLNLAEWIDFINDLVKESVNKSTDLTRHLVSASSSFSPQCYRLIWVLSYQKCSVIWHPAQGFFLPNNSNPLWSEAHLREQLLFPLLYLHCTHLMRLFFSPFFWFTVLHFIACPASNQILSLEVLLFMYAFVCFVIFLCTFVFYINAVKYIKYI